MLLASRSPRSLAWARARRPVGEYERGDMPECLECVGLEECTIGHMIECAEWEQNVSDVRERLAAYVLREPSVVVVSGSVKGKVIG